MLKIKNALKIIASVVIATIFILAVEFAGFVIFSNYSENIAVVLAIPILTSAIFTTTGYIFWRKAHKVDEIKSKFITVAAHRLRVPITRIKWTLDVLSGTTQIEENKTHISNMQKFLKEFAEVINQMLDISETGKTSLFHNYLFTQERLEYIIRSVQSKYTSGIKLKNINLSVKTEQDLPKINVDKERLEEALGVFFENAILYTPEGGNIEVEVYKDKKRIIFSISDTGIGIEKNKIPYIFTKFFRTKEAMAIDMDRAGLGLSIAKDIIERHKGTIKVESRGKNYGSRFTVSLPIVGKI